MNALARLGAPTLERDNVVMVEVLAAFDSDGWRQCATMLNERFSQDVFTCGRTKCKSWRTDPARDAPITILEVPWIHASMARAGLSSTIKVER